MSEHKCVSELNKFLADHNTRLTIGMQLTDNNKRIRERIMIASEKIDTKKRQPALPVLASFCPFCGKELEP